METKSFVMFSTKTKTYAEDIDLGNGTVIKAGTPVNIAWMSFADPESGELAAAFADDETFALGSIIESLGGQARV